MGWPSRGGRGRKWPGKRKKKKRHNRQSMYSGDKDEKVRMTIQMTTMIHALIRIVMAMQVVVLKRSLRMRYHKEWRVNSENDTVFDMICPVNELPCFDLFVSIDCEDNSLHFSCVCNITD
eukprot:339452_1